MSLSSYLSSELIHPENSFIYSIHSSDSFIHSDGWIGGSPKAIHFRETKGERPSSLAPLSLEQQQRLQSILTQLQSARAEAERAAELLLLLLLHYSRDRRHGHDNAIPAPARLPVQWLPGHGAQDAASYLAGNPISLLLFILVLV